MPDNITPEIHGSPTQLAYMLGRLEGKIDGLVATVNSHIVADTTVETRVSKLESGRSWLLGAGATVSAFMAMVAAAAGWHFKA